DAVYLTDNGVVDNNAILLGTRRRNGGLAPGASYAASIDATVALGVEGSKVIVVVTDDGREVFQGNPRPDTSADTPVQVLAAPFALLTVETVTPPDGGFSGQAFPVSWTVRNNGTARTSAEGWRDNVFLSRDAFLDPATAISLGSVDRTAGLDAGASYTATLEAQIPTFLSGTFFVFVVTDTANAVFQNGQTDGKTGRSDDATTIAVPPQVDLEAGPVVVPPAGVSGGFTTTPITWTVTNVSPVDAVGSWVDAIYLSADDVFDSSDVLIDRVTRDGGLTAGNLYVGTTNGPLPALIVPGDYTVLVRVDAQNVVPEDDAENNLGVSADTLALDVTPLTLDAPTAGTVAPSQSVYFRVDVPAGETLRIDTEFDGPFVSEFYVSFGRPPTPADYDLVFERLADTEQRLTVPNTVAGTYYILLRGAVGADDAGSPFTITAATPGFGVEALDFSAASNRGDATLTLTGAKFSQDTAVQLVDGGTVIDATQVFWRDESTLWASFDLRGVEPATFGVRVSDPGRSATLDDAFTVNAEAPGQLNLRVAAPGVIRAGRPGQVVFFVENLGATDIAAPVLLLSADGARLRDETGALRNEIQILGINTTGPAGILPPGFSGTLLYEFELDEFEAGGDNSYSFTAQSLGDLDQEVGWDGLRDAARPPQIDPDAWAVIWDNYTTAVGPTVGDLQNALAETATYLSQLDRYTGALDALVGFRISQADAALLPTPLVTATDLAVPTTGLSLDLRRSIYPSISGRSATGLLGLGWKTPYDIRLVPGQDGELVVDLTTTQVSFVPSPAGGFIGSAGSGTLTIEGGLRVYRDPSGTSYGFDGPADEPGRLVLIRDKNGNQIAATYDGPLLTRLDHTDGTFLTFTYTASGFANSATDSAGRSVIYDYDDTGQRLAAVTTDAGTTTFTYADNPNPAVNGALASVTRPGLATQRFAYDDLGRLTSTNAAADGSGTPTQTYGPQGEVTVVTAQGPITYLLTDFLKPGRLTDALGNVSRVAYDDNGNPTR
ncbi:MAG: hypothetical protein AAF743_07280, partial [Planctomycetota bacterium]